MFDKLISVVGSVAPTIATALGGPLAGGAVKLLTGALGISDKSTEQEITDAVLNANPETLLKIKEAEQQHAQRMKELDIDLERINAQDRDSARNREIKTGDKTPAILGISIVCGFFVILCMMMFSTIPEGSQTVLNIMLGALGTMTAQVGNYFFGSSAGSKMKTMMGIK